MFDNLRPLELIIILVVVLLLFGAKRLPDAARGLGRSMRILKAETKGLRDDDEPVETGYRDTTASRVEVRPLPPAAPATPAPGSERPFDDRTFGQASGSTPSEQPGSTER